MRPDAKTGASPMHPDEEMVHHFDAKWCIGLHDSCIGCISVASFVH
jgi:hypothetical protein